jgi:cytochrome c oxidase subunit II
MSTATPPTPAASAPSHGRRLLTVWLVSAVILTPIVVWLSGTFIPPGNKSEQATQQVYDNQWIVAVITPVVLLMIVFFAYTLTTFRVRDADDRDGPPLRGDRNIQVTWIVVTSAAVLTLAVFGTYELLQNGAGGGQGPDPIAVPSGPKLQVQVIAQQWEFTYRFPTYGGIETPHLELPADTQVEFHVTSLDAIHSFLAYELGVKADANPGVDNVAYVKVKGLTTFHIHCAELCGLWHGYMFDTGQVVSQSDFAAWIKQQQTQFQPVAQYLPKYANSYLPDPQRRAG